MLWHWLTNGILWAFLIVVSCALLQQILKRMREDYDSSASVMMLLGIGGYVLGSIGGWIQGWITVPESITDMADPEPYFHFIHCHGLTGAHVLALFGLIVGFIVVLKRGRKSA